MERSVWDAELSGRSGLSKQQSLIQRVCRMKWLDVNWKIAVGLVKHFSKHSALKIQYVLYHRSVNMRWNTTPGNSLHLCQGKFSYSSGRAALIVGEVQINTQSPKESVKDDNA